MASLQGEALRSPQLLEDMGRSLRHRGPDSRGVYRSRTVALGSERLRIIDLRARADQPFHDPSSRLWLVGNGEIYNAREIRQQYPEYPFQSRSDIESIMPLYLEKGAAGLRELDGMFALAIWDESSHTLTLARDRAGEKPLFYARVSGELWFASEMQTLLLHPTLPRELDKEALSLYLALGYIPEPRTAFQSIRKIAAGTIVQLHGETESVDRYWNPGAFETSEESLESARGRLSSLLTSAIQKQMISDAPVGVFVSGGLDSALIATIASRNEPSREIHTFTARFADPSYDESHQASNCTSRLGTRHHEVIIDEQSLATALDAVRDQLAEPLADPAILPTYLLAKEASQHVKVILSGEGADELFGGYPTYLGHTLVPYIQALPSTVRKALRGAVGLLPASRGKVTVEFLLKRFLADAERPWLDRHLAWFGTGAQAALAVQGQPHSIVPALQALAHGQQGVRGAMLLDYRTYLADCLLVKNDRATMLSSLEARAPFLDRDLAAFAFGLPTNLKVRGLTTKWLLKSAAREWLPKKAIHRRKRGLSVPIASWIDGGLRSEVDRLLATDRLERQELLDPQHVQLLLSEHRAKKVNNARPLWALVILQYWLERWVPERAH